MPILLTNLDLKRKDRSGLMALCEVIAPSKMHKVELEQKYEYFLGKYDYEGAWTCDIKFTTPGPYFFQIIFVNIKEFKNAIFHIEGNHFSICLSYFVQHRCWKT